MIIMDMEAMMLEVLGSKEGDIKEAREEEEDSEKSGFREIEKAVLWEKVGKLLFLCSSPSLLFLGFASGFYNWRMKKTLEVWLLPEDKN